MELRQVLGALAGGDDGEAAGARPVDQLGDQRRLVAIGHRIDRPRRPRALGERRPGEHVRLDIDHDDVLAVLDRRQRMADAGGRVAGDLDHHLDIVARDCRDAVVGELARRDPRLVPADIPTGGAGAVRREIGDCRDPEPGRGRRLREEHRAELSGADDENPHRSFGGDAFGSETGEIHG